jgi:uncharacterized protein YbaP (TraB family)
MKRAFFSGGLFAAAAVFFVSCASLSTPGPSVSSVWEISRDGQTIFLGGSCHILRDTDLPPPAAFDSAFDKSAMLVLEANIGELSDPEAGKKAQVRMALPEGKTLRSTLSGEVYEALELEAQKLGLPSLDAVAQYKVSAAVNVLAFLYMQKHGFINQGIDRHYFDRAQDQEKALDFLETVDFQLELLFGMGEGYEDDYVRYSLTDQENTGKTLDLLVSEWKAGKADAIEAELLTMRDSWPVIYESMVARRNSGWLPKIEAYLLTGPVEFVLVGLAHLHGPDGLLLQLARKGYAIKQLEN